MIQPMKSTRGNPFEFVVTSITVSQDAMCPFSEAWAKLALTCSMPRLLPSDLRPLEQ